MGFFITFEGIEGCGKTTQIKLLHKYLLSKQYPVLLTREPGGTDIGDKIRSILLNAENQKITHKTELLLYLADRSQHIIHVIKPALNEDKVVLCDRFIDATLAYQGYGRGLDISLIEALNKAITNGIVPNLTLLLDCPIEIGLERASKRILEGSASKNEDRFEREGIEFHQRVREGYLNIAKNNPNRVRIVDANKEVGVVQSEIRSIVSVLLNKKSNIKKQD